MSTIEDHVYVENHIPVEICEALIDECNKKEWKKHTWNNFEAGLVFSPYGAQGSLFLSKGLVNENLLNLGVGTGISNIDDINFFSIFLVNSYDVFPINDLANYRIYLLNKIGYSIGKDLGFNDYISTEGGFFLNPSKISPLSF